MFDAKLHAYVSLLIQYERLLYGGDSAVASV